MEILPTTTIEEIKLNVPDADEIFDSFGLECFRCMGGGETLATAAEIHQLDLDVIIEELKRKIGKG